MKTKIATKIENAPATAVEQVNFNIMENSTLNKIIEIIDRDASQWTLGMGASETYNLETELTFRKRGRWEGMDLTEKWIEVAGVSLSPTERGYISQKTGWAIK